MDVFGSVPALSSGGADGVEEALEFFFPVTESVHFDAGDLAGEANADSFIRFLFPRTHDKFGLSLVLIGKVSHE